MMIDNKYEIGDIAYLKTDDEQLPRIVIGISIVPNGLLYRLSFGATDSSHYDFEISTEKNYLLTEGDGEVNA